MIKHFVSSSGVSRNLVPKFKRPYKISKALRNDRYLIENADDFRKSRKPSKGVWAIALEITQETSNVRS